VIRSVPAFRYRHGEIARTPSRHSNLPFYLWRLFALTKVQRHQKPQKISNLRASRVVTIQSQ
jgi:hypothetical protein